MSEGSNDEKQCRICLEGVSAARELGRLISPCYCKGSVRYVHVKCLQQWRKTSVSQSAFFACPQCHYQYRFARTQALGLATNQVVIACLSGLVFTTVVMLASYFTTYFMSFFENLSYPSGSYFYVVSPFEVARDLISAAFRVLRDGDVVGITQDMDPLKSTAGSSPGFVVRFIRRFLLGLPLVGAASLVHLLLSIQVLAPVQWLARYRASRRRNDNRDVAALIVVALIAVGAIRALLKVYKLTEHYTQRLLLRAEDAILEVNI